MLRPSVVCLSVLCNMCIVAKRCQCRKLSAEAIGNDLWEIEWSRDRWRTSRDPQKLVSCPQHAEPNISKTAADAILQQSLIADRLLQLRPRDVTVGYPSDSLASCVFINSKRHVDRVARTWAARGSSIYHSIYNYIIMLWPYRLIVWVWIMMWDYGLCRV